MFLRVGRVDRVHGNEALNAFQIRDDAETHGGNSRGAHGADILGGGDSLDDPAGDIRQNLAGDGRERAAAHKTDVVGGFQLFALALQHPSQMVEYAFQNGADELCFSGFELNAEEHTGGIRILEGTAVAVKPRRKDDSAGPGRNIPDRLGHIVVETGVGALIALGNVLLFKVYADFIQSEMILDPLKALAGSFHLGKVIEFAALRAGDGGNHGGNIHHLPVGNGNDPAGGTGVDMGIAHIDAACAHTDQAGITAAAEYGRAGCEAKLCGCLFGQTAHHIGGLDNFREKFPFDVKHGAHLAAPTLMTGSGIVDQRSKGAVFRHGEAAGAAAAEVILYIQPLVSPGKSFGLMGLDPLIFPHGILDAAGHCAGDHKAGDELENVGPGDLQTVGNAFFDLLLRTLIHVAHGTVDGLAVSVGENETLHLGAEGDTGYLLRLHIGFAEKLGSGLAHGVPPVVAVLLGAAVGHDVQRVAAACGADELNAVFHAEKAGFNSGGPYVVGKNVSQFLFPVSVCDICLLKSKGRLDEFQKLIGHKIVIFKNIAAAVELETLFVIRTAVGELEHHKQVVEEKGEETGVDIPADIPGFLRGGDEVGIQPGGEALNLRGKPGSLLGALGDPVVHTDIVAVLRSKILQCADDRACIMQRLVALFGDLLQPGLQRGQTMPDAGKEEGLLVLIILIDDADTGAGTAGNGAHTRAHAVLGKFAYSALQKLVQLFLA